MRQSVFLNTLCPNKPDYAALWVPQEENDTPNVQGESSFINELPQLVTGRCESYYRGDLSIYGHFRSAVMIILIF